MPAVKFFFLGFPVDEVLSGAMQNCDASDKAFLEDPMYLDAISWEGTKYLGRRIGDSISLEQAGDTARNVSSLISRVVPDWNGSVMNAVLLALDSDESSGVFLIPN